MSLEQVLAELASTDGTQGGFSRAEILPRLAEVAGADADTHFDRIRAAAKGGKSIGGVTVASTGAKRGTRYVFRRIGGEALAARPVAPETAPPGQGTVEIHHGDNLAVTSQFSDASFDLIYIDPPFNTGKSQSRTRLQTTRDDAGDRVGFQGKRYRTTVLGKSGYADAFDDYFDFLGPRLCEARRLLKPNGSFFLHLDYREVHYAKVFLDGIFGRESFINEIIWSYDYGARATNRWSPKHDNILWYAKDPDDYCFNYDEIDRIPYMAPSLVGEEKAARGKTPTDCWWNTIVSPTGKEKTGYPTQKPLSVLTRIVRVHSRPGDRLLDFFAGSGTLGEAAAMWGRHAVLVDENPEAIEIMKRRLAAYPASIQTHRAAVTRQTHLF